MIFFLIQFQYYAICKPLKASYKCTYRRALIIITCLWTIAFVATIPVLFVTELVEALYIDDTIVSVCITKANATWQKVYYLILMTAFFWIPLFVLIVVYCIIIKRLIRDDRRLLVASAQSSISGNITSSSVNLRSSLACVSTASGSITKESSIWPVLLWRHGTNQTSGYGSECRTGSESVPPQPTAPAPPLPTSVGRMAMSAEKAQIRSRRQVVFMLAAVIICFFTCLLPFRLFTLWLLFSSEEEIRALSMEPYYNLLYFCRIMLYVNSMLNPFLYAVVSSKFRTAFVETVCQYCCYYSDYSCCSCSEQDDLDFGKGMGPRGKMRRRYRRNRRFLLRQSTFNTTTTTTTLSSLKNSSLHSNNLESYHNRFSSMDSILANRPKLFLQSQQHSLDLDMSGCHANHEAEYKLMEVKCDQEQTKLEPLSVPEDIVDDVKQVDCETPLNTISQYPAEYRRAIMMKRSSRVAIIDEDDDADDVNIDTSVTSGEIATTECTNQVDPEPDVESAIPNIEDILNDPQFSTYESYV